MAYIANTPDDVRVMLGAIGLDSLDQLFEMIPPEFRLQRPLDIPEALCELELTRQVGERLARNVGADLRPCFLGGGSYDHFIPAVVDHLASRGEFYTAYTPYQPEASQGTLQATFEYQTLITQLTGMEVANASLYDGGSAVAEAVLMALGVTRRLGRVVVAGSVHPEYRQVLKTYAANLEPEIVTLPAPAGVLDPKTVAEAVTDDTAAVVLQYPDFFGRLYDIDALVAIAHAKGALAIVSVDPISLGLLRRPGDYGADIVVAEGQSLGNPLAFGGPYLGIMACREEYVRKMPGRIVGQTTDRHGKRCWVLTLQTREQHIRREKATSNICTNQGLLALRASIYLAALGPTGLYRAAELSTRKAHYAAERLAQVPGLSLAGDGPFFKEFVVRSRQDPARLLEEVGRLGYHGGIALGRWYPDLADCILIAVTEKRTRAEIDGLAEAYTRALERLSAVARSLTLFPEGADMATANRLMTADDWLDAPETPGMRQELIKGELRTMPLPGGRHGKVALKIGRLLGNHVEARALGDTYAAETGFLIERDPDTVRGADVAFVRQERLSQITQPDKHVPFAPDLAVEVISPGDARNDVAEKTAAWLAAGTLLVWNLYAKNQTVSVHRLGAEAVVLTADDELDGGEVVPGFRCRVGDLFS